MATLQKELTVDAPADSVWEAIRDVGAVHRRLVPGLVTDTRLEAGARVVTFSSGLVVRERIVTVDDDRRRLVYAAVGGTLVHHNASMQVFPDGAGRSRVVWITDLLPDEAAPRIGELVERGAEIMARTLSAPR